MPIFKGWGNFPFLKQSNINFSQFKFLLLSKEFYMNTSELQALTVKELQKFAGDLGSSEFSGLRKQDLIKEILGISSILTPVICSGAIKLQILLLILINI